MKKKHIQARQDQNENIKTAENRRGRGIMYDNN